MGGSEQTDKTTEVPAYLEQTTFNFKLPRGYTLARLKFGAPAVPDRGVSDCHDCPEDVCDRKRRSVRMVWA